jgi:hypothetical protein
MLSQPFLLNQMLKLGEKVSNLVELPTYLNPARSVLEQGQFVQE